MSCCAWLAWARTQLGYIRFQLATVHECHGHLVARQSHTHTHVHTHVHKYTHVNTHAHKNSHTHTDTHTLTFPAWLLPQGAGNEETLYLPLHLSPVLQGSTALLGGRRGLLTPGAGARPIWLWPTASKRVWLGLGTWVGPAVCSRDGDNELCVCVRLCRPL